LTALESAQAQTLNLIGRKRPARRLARRAPISAHYQVTNAGQTVFSEQFSHAHGGVPAIQLTPMNP
jgi:hypothetical protein